MTNIGPNDERVKMLAKRNYEKGFLAVDDLFVLGLDECKNSGLSFLLVCEEMITSDEAKAVLEFYKAHTQVFGVSQKVFERIAEKGNTCGMVLYTKLNEMPLEKLNQAKLVLVCDGIEISGNIGTMFRTAEAAKADAILFTNLRAKVFDEKVLHASRGMMFRVPFACLEFDKLVAALGKSKIVPVLCEPEQGKDFKAFDYDRPVALVVGSERFGADKRWFDVKGTEFLKIPMFGKMDSLNVGVAASLILYEARYGQGLPE